MSSPDICTEDQTPDIKPDISEFFRDKCVLITGGTGFVGKILIEKILRSCPDVDTLYLLMRSKRGVEPEQRLVQLIQNKVFNRVLAERGETAVLKQLRPIEGDISVPGLGLSTASRTELCRRVQIVFHVAATVRFDEPLRVAVLMNTRGTRELLTLAKDMPHLKAVVHTSTLFSNCQHDEILEEIYPCAADPEKLIQCAEWMHDNWIDAFSPMLLEGRPNTYVYTKHLAEKLVEDASKTLPIAIFRPSIVMSTLSEPEPGWVENLNGPSGIVAAAGTCMLSALHCNVNKVAEVTPVDSCANIMLAIAWYLSNYRPSGCEVYNFTPPQGHGLTWKVFYECYSKFMNKYPFSNALSTSSFFLTDSALTVHIMQTYLLMWAYLADIFAGLIGHKKKLVTLQNRITQAASRLEYFTTNQWQVNTENVYSLLQRLSIKDTLIFNFDLRNINWYEYVFQYCHGVRRHIMRENDSTAPAARRRLSRMRWTNRIIILIVCVMIYQFFLAPTHLTQPQDEVPALLTTSYNVTLMS